MYSDKLSAIINAYDDYVIRWYCRIRFLILRQRFLDEIGQYLPASGKVLDIGCGFGLFALYFAGLNPNIEIHGIDLSERRIACARRAAAKLGLTNVHFEVRDARNVQFDECYVSAYMLDLIHHIPMERVEPLLRHLTSVIQPGGRVIVKDVDTRPGYKRLVTWILDKVMDFKAPVRYWSQAEFMQLFTSLGLEVYRHAMVDVLPYPHMIYINRVPSAAPGRGNP